MTSLDLSYNQFSEHDSAMEESCFSNVCDAIAQLHLLQHLNLAGMNSTAVERIWRM